MPAPITSFCHYGDANAIIRADIRVEPGKLTEATLYQQAARVTLKLVENHGGEALANTQWSVVTSAGEAWSERRRLSVGGAFRGNTRPSPSTTTASSSRSSGRGGDEPRRRSSGAVARLHRPSMPGRVGL
jgi:hypothetical protein